VLDNRKPLTRLSPDALGRRVRRDELWKRLLELFESRKEAVILLVRDLWPVHHIVQIIVASNLPTERLDVLFGLVRGTACDVFPKKRVYCGHAFSTLPPVSIRQMGLPAFPGNVTLP